MKRIALILFCMLSITACSKSDDNKEVCPTGTVRFTNNSSNPYKVYVDGGFRTTLSGKSFIEYELDKGSHALKVIQASGYVFYPTERNTDVYLSGCDDREFIFP